LAAFANERLFFVKEQRRSSAGLAFQYHVDLVLPVATGAQTSRALGHVVPAGSAIHCARQVGKTMQPQCLALEIEGYSPIQTKYAKKSRGFGAASAPQR
jgi:hypothetical protein